MAKNMARIEDGVVVNIEWHLNVQEETDDLREVGDLIIEIGDTYDGSFYYRNGELLLTPFDQVCQKMIALQKENEELTNCVLEMSETVYA